MIKGNKKILLFIAMALLLLIAGCGPAVRPPAGQDGNQPSNGVSMPPETSVSKQASPATSTMTLMVYFGTKDAQYLVPEERTVAKNDHPAQTALELLLAGPTRPDLVPVLPAGVKLRSVVVRDHVAYVDFNSALVKNNHTGSAGEMLQVASIVNTLTNFPEIEKVQILVEGQRVPTLAGHLDVSEPLSRSESIIKK